uniref:Uncharacterized protein n=1 Tax=Tanacetum cinerariifolium TaxID=118510 RepID=A0A6L2LFB3_TANCI|nr:hypothetical protein [Tanacetum cinerariifolium]
MTSFGYRLNPRYAIKECLSCGALYIGDFCCSKGNVEDKILVPKLPKNYARCGNPVNGSTNVVNAPREPFVFKQDHDVNLLHIDECCCECVPCVSKPNFVDETSNIFNPPPQPPIYSCEFCGSNAQYGHYCTPQVPFINPDPSYSQDFNFPQDIHDFQQQYLCCDQYGGPHETFQCQQNRPAFFDDDDDDDVDYTIAITPVLSTEESDKSLSMGDEHLDTIPATKSDKVIKSSVENLIPISSESEGIPDTMCDVHLVNNHTPLEAKDHFKIVINSNDDISPSDDDSLYNENIEYVEASPHDSELVSLEVAEIVIPEDEEIKDDNLREKLLNVRLLIANIEALKDNPTPSSEFLTKSSFTSLKSFLEETNTFHNSLLKLENFCFDLEEISSGSTTTYSDISLSDYEFFCFDDDHIKEISSGSTTTHSDISLSEYDSFIFDLSKDQFPPTDRSDFTHEDFADELAHIISPPEYDCFYFRNLPDTGWSISITFRFSVGLQTPDDLSRSRLGFIEKMGVHG